MVRTVPSMSRMTKPELGRHGPVPQHVSLHRGPCISHLGLYPATESVP
jgi:hypothetical protein